GEIRIDVVHTPGHTPEHLTFLVTEERVSSEPFGAFTGDFLLAGDVGRPAVAEDGARRSLRAEAAAHEMYRSLAAFSPRADSLLLWPGHRSGRAGSPGAGGSAATTLGYEKVTNWALTATDEHAFVAALLADQPDEPRYFAEVKCLNRIPPLPSIEIDTLPRVDEHQLDQLVLAYSQFLDVRPGASSGGFLSGSIALPLTPDFVRAAGCVLRYGMPIYIVAPDVSQATGAAEALRLIGLDEVRGWIPGVTVEAYGARAGGLERLDEIGQAEALARQAAGQLLVDVRTTGERRAGHVPGAIHAPIGRLVDATRKVDRDTRLVVYS